MNFSKEQWDALKVIIPSIDGGCNVCISDFLGRLGKFNISVEQLEEIEGLEKKDIKYILGEWAHSSRHE